MDFAGTQHLRRDSGSGMDAFCVDSLPHFFCSGDFLNRDLFLVPGGDYDGRRGAGYAEVVI